ncbi:bifunctional riboflavin kinase/FAD synthetase [Winogradskyella sp. 3972H.M.0a.05]|uniref:bifunctional riboflavin kinase/FAD synthetase n=1 Tax=Winogradskyella sp. 3972H.M.0a.05 TaxID=2950277 RepID=UPI0033947665
MDHSNTNNPNQTKGSVVTIGTFDGVHIGHQKILEQLLHVANQRHLEPKVLTFFPHPRMVIQPDFKIELLTTIEEKRDILSDLGINAFVIKPFTKEFANLSAEAYVKTVLVDELNAKHIIIGYDHRFGKNRSADINDLRNFGQQYGFSVDEIPAQDIKDIAVSSTKIRQALSQGELSLANSYLGYHYFINGIIIKGKGLGKTIDFPTANIYVDKTYKLIPKQGVYAVQSIIDSKRVFGMMNIGTNPTVDGSKESIEVHFFNFDQDIYGKTLKVEFLHRLRDEKKFESVEALKEQLGRDKANALSLIEKSFS